MMDMKKTGDMPLVFPLSTMTMATTTTDAAPATEAPGAFRGLISISRPVEAAVDPFSLAALLTGLSSMSLLELEELLLTPQANTLNSKKRRRLAGAATME